jgi:sulfatase maturation enzyme AslB (radical SAM superfamily)
MANRFCRFLSNGYSIELTGSNLKVKPCCWYRGGFELDDNLGQNIQSRSQITSWTPMCEVCEKQELAGQHSFRQSSFDIVPDIESNAPVAVDINIDMTCNAACVICSPLASSLWAKQIAKKNKSIIVQSTNNLDNALDKILYNLDLSQLRRIKFFGGEPLLTDTHLKILQKIPNPGQVDVWYTTNASIFPKEQVLKIWDKFKLIYFEASIDAIESQFEYIRWPLHWPQVQGNLLLLKSNGPNNLLFRINHTLNPFNVLYYDRLHNWVQDNLSTNRLGDRTEINIHPCWGTWGLDRTPIELREKVHNKYPHHVVSNILSLQTQNDYNDILAFTKEWDPIRKLYWQNIFPEIVSCFP